MVWASAEPASRSAASGASETGEDLFIAYSFSDCCSGLKSTACRLTKSLEQAVAEFCSVAHGRFRVAEETNSGGNCIDRKCLYRPPALNTDPKKRKKASPKTSLCARKRGGSQERNRTTDTRIFSSSHPRNYGCQLEDPETLFY